MFKKFRGNTLSWLQPGKEDFFEIAFAVLDHPRTYRTTFAVGKEKNIPRSGRSWLLGVLHQLGIEFSCHLQGFGIAAAGGQDLLLPNFGFLLRISNGPFGIITAWVVEDFLVHGL